MSGVTAADLATEQSRTAKCTALGGTYTPADTIATSAAALAEGLTKPLEEQVKTTTAANSTLTTQVATLTTELNAVKANVAALHAGRDADQAHARLGQGQDRRRLRRRGRRHRASR